MDPERYALVADLLSEAIERPEAERERFLIERCPDASIRGEVLELLGAERAGGAFSETVIESRRRELSELFETPDAAATEAGLPETIGSYRVIRRIGEGGMGVVFEAEQASPRRRVAVKVVDSIRVGGGLEKRLRQEAEIQGRLQHPGIAQIYEAGTARVGESVRPFFAMEYIRGETLAVHAASLDLRGVLELLAAVAGAAGFAHSKGVVHRDLKPDNILVLPTGQPKVLDFGIAELAGDSTIGLVTITQQGQFAGTIGYMAPEQFAGSPDRVGPQADVYALGVIAYELIARRPPFEVAGLSISAAIRAIENASPQPLRAAGKGISRDLETIVHRCLDADPLRRYADGTALASDLRRLLADQPIIARPATRRYRAAKFVQRNRLLVGGVGATIASLSIGLVATGYFASGQQRARVQAERERSFAVQKELDAVRGVLAAASTLGEKGEIWDAVRQLHAIAPETRGWAWRHTALSLPWLVERPGRSDDAGEPAELVPMGFVDDERAVFLSMPSGEAVLLDLPGGVWRRIPTGARFFANGATPIAGEPGRITMVDVSDRVGWLDADTGGFEPTGQTVDERMIQRDRGSLGALAMADPASVLALYTTTVRLSTPGLPTLTLGEDAVGVPHPGPWWELSTPPAGTPFVVLGRWAIGQIPAEILCLDRRTNTVAARVPASYAIPGQAMDVDGARVYTRSPTGLDILAVPSLERIGSVEHIGSALNTVPMPGGGAAFVPVGTERVHFLDGQGALSAWPEPIGSESFPRTPVFAPGGRLLLARMPMEGRPWVIDTAHPIEPRLRSVTPLVGHGSWVYQIAVSADGSLLASAAPRGDVLLWDLRAGRLIARVHRAPAEHEKSLTAHMDAPLLFSAGGEALIFGEFRPDEDRMGFTTLDIRTGERVWVGVAGRADMHERIGVQTGWAPGSLYHHAAVLPGQRILEAVSARLPPQRVVVRPARGDGPEALLSSSGAKIAGGVAVHPDGTRFVSADFSGLSVRDAGTLETIARLAGAGTRSVYGVAYSPDGERLAVGTEYGTVLIYETRFHKRIAEIRPPHFDGADAAPPDGERDYIYALAWTPDGTRLVCSGGETIRVLESERPYARDRSQSAWEAELRAARAGRAASAEAARVATIERLVREGVLK